MGKIVQVQCTRCGFRKELLTGGGLSDCKLRTILEALSSREQQKKLAAAINQGAGQVSISRQPRVCDACGTIQAIPVVTYTLSGTQKMIFGVCSQCGKVGDSIWDEAQTGRCPTCGAAVRIQNAGHWD